MEADRISLCRFVLALDGVINDEQPYDGDSIRQSTFKERMENRGHDSIGVGPIGMKRASDSIGAGPIGMKRGYDSFVPYTLKRAYGRTGTWPEGSKRSYDTIGAGPIDMKRSGNLLKPTPTPPSYDSRQESENDALIKKLAYELSLQRDK